MFRFPSVICTRCTGYFCLAIIKGPPNDIYCIIEEPYKHYFTEKVSYSLVNRNTCVAPVLLCHSVGKQYCSLGFPRTYRRTGKLHSSCQKYSIISAKKIRLCVLYGMGNL